MSRAFRVFVIEGDTGAKHSTAQQIYSRGSQDFSVGQAYPIVKQDARSLTLLMHDKKGCEFRERLDITGVTEK